MDGTLVTTDLLWETLMLFISRHPFQVWRVPFWLLTGKANRAWLLTLPFVLSQATSKDTLLIGLPLLLLFASRQPSVEKVLYRACMMAGMAAILTTLCLAVCKLH